jgi:hypothetical protein
MECLIEKADILVKKLREFKQLSESISIKSTYMFRRQNREITKKIDWDKFNDIIEQLEFCKKRK